MILQHKATKERKSNSIQQKLNPNDKMKEDKFLAKMNIPAQQFFQIQISKVMITFIGKYTYTYAFRYSNVQLIEKQDNAIKTTDEQQQVSQETRQLLDSQITTYLPTRTKDHVSSPTQAIYPLGQYTNIIQQMLVQKSSGQESEEKYGD